MTTIENQVLANDARKSENFYTSDLILRHYLDKHLSGDTLGYIDSLLEKLGEQAAVTMDELATLADQNPPELLSRTPLGRDRARIRFHPAYWRLVDIAAQSEMFFLKYEPDHKKRFAGQRHRMGFAAGQLYAMSELGVYCPLCMTDGAAYVLERHAQKKLCERLIPGLSARRGDGLLTGAMFLTEKSGGSDVGRNLAQAEAEEGDWYRLKGEKWFCSNVNADVILALARTGETEEGTRGLSLFLVERKLPDGTENPMQILRLKDKLGVRSMATGEVRFDGTLARLIGNEGEGFKLMTDMINMSRVYNAVTAVAALRRAATEAWQYLNHRVIFGKRAVEHALIRKKFDELGSLHVANFYLVWRTLQAMDEAETGDKEERERMRMLIPMAKWWSAETAVYGVRECMELMGGNGYIEDFIIPRLFRDTNVLPIWEGSGNVIVLDMLRAMRKTDGLKLLAAEIREYAGSSSVYGSFISEELDYLLHQLEEMEKAGRDRIESAAKPLFRTFIHLFQMATMIRERDDTSAAWIDPALRFMQQKIKREPDLSSPPGREETEKLIAWQY